MQDAIVTVFGGTGFLGRAIVRALAQRGARVRVAARHPDAADFSGLGTIDRCTADVRDDDTVAGAVAGARAAVNAVGLYVERRALSFQSVHVEGAARVARAARAAGLQTFVHVSGIGADPASPSPYVAARGRGEDLVRGEHPEAVVLRPSVLFGPGDAFLSNLDALSRLPVIPLFGGGATRLQPVHVDDVAAAAAALLLGGGSGGPRVFELGGAGIYAYREILSLVLAFRRRRALLLPVPFPAWRAMARLGALLPDPPLTPDQVCLLERDNLVGAEAASFADLGLSPRSLEGSLGDCLGRGD